MRRIWAFIVMVASLVLGVLFCGQPIAEHLTYSSEFANGVELVYSLSRREGGREINPSTIGDKVMERLDKADIKNAHVEVVGEGDNAELRVNFTHRNLNEIELVKKQIKATGELTILVPTNEGDYYLTGTEFFDSDSPLTLTYVGSNAYPGFKIKSKAVADSFARHFPDNSSSSDSESSSTTVYIFQDFNPDTDSYDAAFGENVQKAVKDKVIASIAWEGNYMESSNVLYTTADENGSAFTIASANAYVNAYNSSDYGVDIQYLYQDSTSASLGTNVKDFTFIAIGVLMLLIVVCWISFYGLSGFAGSLAMIFSSALTLMLATFLGFEYAPASIMALIVSILLFTFNSQIAQEKIKGELKKGRSIAKATSEGLRKSLFFTLDTSLVTFVIALFTFIIGKSSIKTFGGVLLIGSLVSFLINYFVYRTLMYFLSTSSLAQKNNLGLKIKNYSEKKYALPVEKRKKNNKIYGIIGGALAVASCALLVTTNFTTGMFKLADGYEDSGRVAIKVSSYEADYYQEEEDFLKFVVASVGEVNSTYADFEYDDFFFERDTLKDDDGIEYYQIYASFKIDSSLAQDEDFINSFERVNEAITLEDSEASILIAPAKVVNSEHDVRYLLLVVGLSVAFASAFFLLRYGIYVFLTYLLSGTIIGATSIGLFSALMLPMTPFVVFGLLAITAITSIIFVALFDRNRENNKLLGKKITFEGRVSSMEESLAFALPNSIALAGNTLVGSILVILCTSISSLMSSYLILTIGVVLGTAYIIAFAPSFYLFVRAHIKYKSIDFSKLFKKFKRKKKAVVVNENEPHETIVMGLNDFR